MRVLDWILYIEILFFVYAYERTYDEYYKKFRVDPYNFPRLHFTWSLFSYI